VECLRWFFLLFTSWRLFYFLDLFSDRFSLLPLARLASLVVAVSVVVAAEVVDSTASKLHCIGIEKEEGLMPTMWHHILMF